MVSDYALGTKKDAGSFAVLVPFSIYQESISLENDVFLLRIKVTPSL